MLFRSLIVDKMLDKIEHAVDLEASQKFDIGSSWSTGDSEVTIWKEKRTLQKEEAVFHRGLIFEQIGDIVLRDPMGPSKFVNKKAKAYLAFRPEHIGAKGGTDDKGGYVFFVSPSELRWLVRKDMPSELKVRWKEFVIHSVSHELTHIVQNEWYPGIFEGYVGPEQKYKEYRAHPAEREAQLASVEAMLRYLGPTDRFMTHLETAFEPNEIKRLMDPIRELVRKYRQRIADMASSMMTADAIAKRLGLTEIAMSEFMKQQGEGRLMPADKAFGKEAFPLECV